METFLSYCKHKHTTNWNGYVDGRYYDVTLCHDCDNFIERVGNLPLDIFHSLELGKEEEDSYGNFS